MTRVAINGFGRIGRQSFKALLANYGDELEIVAVNDLSNVATLAHLLKYDSNYGQFDGDVKANGDIIEITYYDEEGNEREMKLKVLAERDPAALPWAKLGVDIVIESTGRFTEADKAKAHITAGAKKVIISAPAKGEDITICLGVNEGKYDNEFGSSNQKHFNANSCSRRCVFVPTSPLPPPPQRRDALPAADTQRRHRILLLRAGQRIRQNSPRRT